MTDPDSYDTDTDTGTGTDADSASAPRDAAAEPARAHPQAAPRSPRCRVLIVDDNVDSADSLTAVVRMFGHDAETAYDGLAAVEKAIALVPDLILMDITLPKLSGYEAAARIRASPGCEHTVLVALTGWGREEDKREALEAGFTFHFIKPVDFPALKRLLAETSAAPT